MKLSRRLFAIGLAAVPVQSDSAQAEKGSEQSDHHSSASSNLPPSRLDQLFDAHEFATVEAMAEIIIPATDTPGAREAHVAQHLDRILHDSPLPVQTSFLEGLWWTDGFCRRSWGAPFKDLRPDDQVEAVSRLLLTHDDGLATGRTFVHSLKSWTAKIYYSTEIGVAELNKGGRVPPTYSRQCTS